MHLRLALYDILQFHFINNVASALGHTYAIFRLQALNLGKGSFYACPRISKSEKCLLFLFLLLEVCNMT